MPFSLQEIVSTYELPDLTKEKIFRLASRHIKEFSLTSFEEQYKYVADLVEKFGESYLSKKAVRLGSVENPDLYLFKNGEENNGGLIEIEEKPRVFTELSPLALITKWDSYLTEAEKSIILKLLANTTVQHLNFDIPEEDPTIIKQRLGNLIQLMHEQRGFQQPERPIVYIRLDDSPYVRFGRRHFNGNPLAYFNAHRDVYGSMSRRELQKFDMSLYIALWKNQNTNENGTVTKQINLAIPNVRKRNFNGDPLAYFKSNETRYFGLSRKDLAKVDSGLESSLRRAGQIELAVPGRKRKTKEVYKLREKIICEAYDLLSGNANLVYRELGIESKTVWDIWKRNGLKAMGKGGGRKRYP